MEHFRFTLRRSWDASWSLFFAAPAATVALAILVWLLTLALQGGKLGPIMNALAGLGWTLLATAMVFGALFLAQFCYVTPKRMVAEAEQRTKEAEDRSETMAETHKNQLQSIQSELNQARASVAIKPLEIEWASMTKNKTNQTQQSKEVMFDGNCLIGIHNPNLHQGTGQSRFTLLSISPPFQNKKLMGVMLNDDLLKQIYFPIPGIEKDTLEGNQRRSINLFTATRPPYIEASLQDIAITFSRWIAEKRVPEVFFPTASEHIVTVEVSGSGAGATVVRFLARFSTDQKEPVLALTRLDS